MSHRLRSLAALLCAALATGCAGFEQTMSSPLSPTSPTSVAIPSLIGTWTSSSVTTVGSSCTNFQWRVTGQSANSLSGDLSAECVGGIRASGTVSGQLSGTEVPYQVVGTATVPGGVSCPVTINGTARLEGDAIRIPYEGTSCLGPFRGEEVLRRPVVPPPAPTPAPTPSPTPTPEPTPEPTPQPPATNPFHIGAGSLTADRAYQVVKATSQEFPSLTTARPTEAESVAGTTELLRRMIWHLQLAGFQAGRQRNPSGAISGDKLTIVTDGAWHAYDVFRSVGTAGFATDVIFLDVGSPSSVPDSGIPD